MTKMKVLKNHVLMAVSSSKCTELMVRLKEVKGGRHKQFCRALPSGALTRTDIKLLGNGI